MIRLVVARYTFGCRSVYKPIPKITAADVATITQRLRTMTRKPNIKSMGLRSVSTEFGSKASTQCLPVADVRRVRCAVAANRTSTHQPCRGSKLTAFARIRPVLARRREGCAGRGGRPRPDRGGGQGLRPATRAHRALQGRGIRRRLPAK